MNRYQWRETGGPTPRVDAETFGGMVERLADGAPVHAVAPEAVVDEAAKRGSPIKRLFNWDDRSAAHAHRIQQARKFIGMLEVVVVEQRTGRATSSRAFYSIVSDEGRAYMAHDRVLTDRDARLHVIGDARRDLERFLAKYGTVLRLFGNYIPKLQGVINEMGADIGKLADRATKPPRPKGRQRQQRQHQAGANP